jgi:hypothetical protein
MRQRELCRPCSIPLPGAQRRKWQQPRRRDSKISSAVRLQLAAVSHTISRATPSAWSHLTMIRRRSGPSWTISLGHADCPGLFQAVYSARRMSHLDCRGSISRRLAPRPLMSVLGILQSKTHAEALLRVAVHDGNLRVMLGVGLRSTDNLPTSVTR